MLTSKCLLISQLSLKINVLDFTHVIVCPKNNNIQELRYHSCLVPINMLHCSLDRMKLTKGNKVKQCVFVEDDVPVQRTDLR